MSVALRGYAEIKCGRSMRLPDQHKAMSKFYHGKEPSHPPQIKLFAEAHVNYQDFYTTKVVQSSKKKDTTANTTRYHLKTRLTQEIDRLYFSGSDLCYLDLEKKNRTGTALITGRNLVDMALRGVRNFKKAYAYALHKWDAVKLQPKESGTTIDDVINYVWTKMYEDLVTPKDKDNDSDYEEDKTNSTPNTEIASDDNNGGDKTNEENDRNSIDDSNVLAKQDKDDAKSESDDSEKNMLMAQVLNIFKSTRD